MNIAEQPQTLTVMEGGFKKLPGREEEFWNMYEKMLPLAMSQDGFNAAYGGPILNSEWLYFGARFNNWGDMERWYQLPQHRAIQKQAYNRWWSAAYLRKWRLPTEDEGYKGRVMCETRISTGRALDTDETARLCQILKSLSEHAVLPFESLKGEFESQPYQLVGPVQQAPIPEVSFHALVTHWDNKSDFDHWAASPTFATLGEFGPVTSEVFIEFVEVGDRDFMTDDRLQRDWKKASVG